MSDTSTNGHAVPGLTRDQVLQARRKVQLLRAEIEVAHLQQVQKLTGRSVTESIGNYWMDVVGERLSRWSSDPSDMVWGIFGSRRRGANYPIFQDETQLRLLVMQSRILCACNSYAIGLLEGLTSYVLADGMVYRATSKHSESPQDELADAIQDLIDNFLESCGWYGGVEPGLEEELFKRSLRDGEYILCHWPQDDGSLQVRTVEPEQLTAKPGGGDEWLFGIRTPLDDVQKHEAYWVQWGEQLDDAEEYDSSRVIHFRRNVDRSIKRGIPDFSFSTEDILKIALDLRKNMGAGAAIQASYAGIRQHESATKADVQSMQELLSTYTATNPNTQNKEYFARFPIGMVDIPKGMQFVAPPNAQNAAAHVEILQACLRGAGQRWNCPEWLSSGDSSNNNYASSLTAESQFVKRVKREQRRYKSAFLETVWKAINHAIATRGGQLLVRKKRDDDSGLSDEKTYTLKDVQRLIEIQVEAPNPEARDKLQEAQRDQIYIQAGVQSVQTTQQQLGLDPEQELVNAEEYQERMGQQQGGLPLPGQGGELPGQESGGDSDAFQEAIAVQECPQCGGDCKIGECKATRKPGICAKPKADAPTAPIALTPSDSHSAIPAGDKIANIVSGKEKGDVPNKVGPRGFPIVTTGGKGYLVKPGAAGVTAQNEALASKLGHEIAGVDIYNADVRTVAGKPAAVSEWIQGSKSLEDMGNEDAKRKALQAIPRAHLERHALFDYAIGAADAHDGNFVVKDNRLIAIDKGVTFGAGKGDLTTARLPDYLRLASDDKTIDGFQFSKPEIEHMAGAADKMADALEAKGFKKESAGVRARGKVLSDFAKSDDHSAKNLDQLGAFGPHSVKPPSGLAGFLSGLFQ